MEDIVGRAQRQLASFRMKELKDALSRLGFHKSGTKKVLMERLMALLLPPPGAGLNRVITARVPGGITQQDYAAKIVNEIYHQMHSGSRAGELDKAASNAGTGLVAKRPKHESMGTIRCPCGTFSDTGVMVQCDTASCGVWQHVACVILKPDGAPDAEEPQIPTKFFCELCRLQKGDPFVEAVAHLQLPVTPQVPIGASASTGGNLLHTLERTFLMLARHRQALQGGQHELQVWSMLLNDKVPLRMHWPLHSEVRVNGTSVRVVHRPGQQALGLGGRDEAPSITAFTREGQNRLTVSAYDNRPFVVGVRLVRRRSLAEVLAMLPPVDRGEALADALARVRRCVGGGTAGGSPSGSGSGSGSDSELELVQDHVVVNLRCPMSGSRIREAGRFKECGHLGCFDLATLVELNKRARKWQCPTCGMNYSMESLIIDPYFHVLVTAMAGYEEEVTEVEVKADGSWRPRMEGAAGRSEPWRAPPGSGRAPGNGCSSSEGGPRERGPAMRPAAESSARPPLRLGIKRKSDGSWAINGISVAPAVHGNGAVAKQLDARASGADSGSQRDSKGGVLPGMPNGSCAAGTLDELGDTASQIDETTSDYPPTFQYNPHYMSPARASNGFVSHRAECLPSAVRANDSSAARIEPSGVGGSQAPIELSDSDEEEPHVVPAPPQPAEQPSAWASQPGLSGAGRSRDSFRLDLEVGLPSQGHRPEEHAGARARAGAGEGGGGGAEAGAAPPQSAHLSPGVGRALNQQPWWAESAQWAQLPGDRLPLPPAAEPPRPQALQGGGLGEHARNGTLAQEEGTTGWRLPSEPMWHFGGGFRDSPSAPVPQKEMPLNEAGNIGESLFEPEQPLGRGEVEEALFPGDDSWAWLSLGNPDPRIDGQPPRGSVSTDQHGPAANELNEENIASSVLLAMNGVPGLARDAETPRGQRSHHSRPRRYLYSSESN